MKQRLSAGVMALALTLWGCAGEEAAAVIPPVSYNQLVRGCIASTACGVKAYPRVYNCVDAYYKSLLVFGYGRIYDAIYHCVNQADGDCDEVFSCFGTHRLAGSCDSTFKARCEEDLAVSCDLLDHHVFTYDCSAAGLKCGVKQSQPFAAYCAFGTCASGYKARCDAERLLKCEDGVVIVEDCKAQGKVCGKNAQGNSTCLGNMDTSCNAQQYAAKCENDSALSCVGDKVHKVDCSQQIYSKKCSNGVCAPTSAGCSLDAFDRCSGARLEYCLDGVWVAQDCAEMGFGPCAAVTNGARCGVTGK